VVGVDVVMGCAYPEFGPKRLKISIRPAERACFTYLLHNVRRLVAQSLLLKQTVASSQAWSARPHSDDRGWGSLWTVRLGSISIIGYGDDNSGNPTRAVESLSVCSQSARKRRSVRFVGISITIRPLFELYYHGSKSREGGGGGSTSAQIAKTRA